VLPSFCKSQKCGEGGNTSIVVGHCILLYCIILNFGASEDSGMNIS
jgi:hypothetical protein